MIFFVFRFLHVVSGTMWLGEVLLINAILVPFLLRCNAEMRDATIVGIFAKVFKMASVFAGTATVSGIVLFLLAGSAEWPLVLGMVLLTGFTVFHFIKSTMFLRKIERKQFDEIFAALRIVPRVGLVVISTIFVILTYSAPLYLI